MIIIVFASILMLIGILSMLFELIDHGLISTISSIILITIGAALLEFNSMNLRIKRLESRINDFDRKTRSMLKEPKANALDS